MNPPEVLDVNPGTLRLPSSRRDGADPVKLQRQIAKHGGSIVNMPPIFVYRAADGELVVYDGVTRATRVAKLLPGQLVSVHVIGSTKSRGARFPTVGEKLT